MHKNGSLIPCLGCGKVLYKRPSQTSPRTFCSRRCHYANVPSTPASERVWAKIAKGRPDECWLWTGAAFKNGYGAIRENGKTLRAHRVALESVSGPIPDGAHVLHACDTPLCCNPSHLSLGTPKANSDDKVAKGRDNNRGTKHHAAKLTEADVIEIRTSKETGQFLARKFGLSEGAVSQIRSRKAWKSLP